MIKKLLLNWVAWWSTWQNGDAKYSKQDRRSETCCCSGRCLNRKPISCIFEIYFMIFFFISSLSSSVGPAVSSREELSLLFSPESPWLCQLGHQNKLPVKNKTQEWDCECLWEELFYVPAAIRSTPTVRVSNNYLVFFYLMNMFSNNITNQIYSFHYRDHSKPPLMTCS